MRTRLLEWVLPAEDPAWARLPTPDDLAGKSAPSPAAGNERLDELLPTKDYGALRDELSSTPVDRRMDWLKHRLLDGGTAFLAFRYINHLDHLWKTGVAPDDPDKDMRITAGGIALYAYQLIVIDGAKCEDQSTADMHMRDLLRQRAVTHLKKQPVETRIKVVDLALRMEQATAQKRQDDDWLCRGGARAPAPFRYVAKFLPSERYAPLQEKARASMREQLLALVK